MESTFSCCAYCWEEEKEWSELLHYKCGRCGKHAHYDCIKSTQPSPLLGDTLYHFKCQSCGEEKKEEFLRMNVSWRQVVMLALFNLHKTGQGRRGYFHWRIHICAFIDTHWLVFFGHQRKKTGLWMGTVAGTLSTGCPEIFESGVYVVEQGYWKLVSVTPPLPVFAKKSQKAHMTRKRQADEPSVNLNLSARACRKTSANSLSAAIELKEKRATMTDNRRKKKKVNDLDVASQETMNDSTTEKDTSLKKVFAGHPITGKAAAQRNVLSGHPTKEKAISQRKVLAGHSETKSCPSSINQDVNQSETESLNKWSDASSCQSEDLDSHSVSSSDISLQISTQNPHLLESESTDSHISPIPVILRDISTDSEVNIIKHKEVDMDSESDLDIDIESMIMPLSEMNDERSLSPDIKTLLDIGQPSTAIPGKSPVKMENLHVHEGTDHRDDDSGGADERTLCGGNNEAEEDSLESDTDEEEEEEEEEVDDFPKGSSQDENSDCLSSKEHSVIKSESKSVLLEKKKKIGRPRKRRRMSDLPPESPPQSLKRVSLFEEGELLNKLNAMAEKHNLTTELAQLRRKLLCNQTNREFGLPVFDLDAQMEKVAKQHCFTHDTQQAGTFAPKIQFHPSLIKETRDLDRFMMKNYGKKTQSRTYSRFYQRLVGLDDQELQPIVSPYTTRILMPFIWRNYDMTHQPLKMRLLQEIKRYPHRNDPTWKPDPLPPIDYCYVRPEHIPSVNALCREFFWPGIDMSECLQYPDFSCVVLYRKIVIGFAFMVPDRGFNEAYISFIFTHPEWRNVGIASFMLYHLIQTCMGKDVLLHVSASSPAMLLYQKFGFKAQELILNFYYKYFPLNSADSHHAFLMRLSR